MTRIAQAVQPVSGPVIRVGCKRPGASPVPDEWLPRSGFGRGYTEPGLQANWQNLSFQGDFNISRCAESLEVRAGLALSGGGRAQRFSRCKAGALEEAP
jgi:hypothetical protein